MRFEQENRNRTKSYQRLLSLEARSEGDSVIVSVLIEEFEDVSFQLKNGVEPVDGRVNVFHAKTRSDAIRVLRRFS